MPLPPAVCAAALCPAACIVGPSFCGATAWACRCTPLATAAAVASAYLPGHHLPCKAPASTCRCCPPFQRRPPPHPLPPFPNKRFFFFKQCPADVDIIFLQNPFEHLQRDSDVEGMSDGWDNATACESTRDVYVVSIARSV